MHSALSLARWAAGGGATRDGGGGSRGQRDPALPGGQQPGPHLHLDQGRLQTGQASAQCSVQMFQGFGSEEWKALNILFVTKNICTAAVVIFSFSSRLRSMP